MIFDWFKERKAIQFLEASIGKNIQISNIPKNIIVEKLPHDDEIIDNIMKSNCYRIIHPSGNCLVGTSSVYFDVDKDLNVPIDINSKLINFHLTKMIKPKIGLFCQKTNEFFYNLTLNLDSDIIILQSEHLPFTINKINEINNYINKLQWYEFGY